MRHPPLKACCLFVVLLLVVACGGTTRSRALIKADPTRLSAEELAARELQLRIMEEERRAGRSQIPGLTVGQTEDMPPLPPLPSFIDEGTSPEQVVLHARLTAEAESLWLLPSTIGVDDRVAYLMYFWHPRFEVRQARMETMRRERETLNTRWRGMLAQESIWRDEQKAGDRAWREALLAERLYLVPISED